MPSTMDGSPADSNSVVALLLFFDIRQLPGSIFAIVWPTVRIHPRHTTGNPRCYY
ncbi:hypothetical protein CGRA01v4_09710 [Colletotrichum graminicola]|nr:hypothetical protein CGRA01v4_09710 [Colletotrichum graminicola]